ncbi:MAG: polysulfide reductase NrfD [Thiotrichales bacterium]|nr:polysulfide reductase NrfD [Thiotrichales bacterium]
MLDASVKVTAARKAMRHIEFRETEGRGAGFPALVLLLALVTLAGVLAGHHMDVEGHHVTGMNNRIVWGLPHVFAVFLIVAASGALNVASLSSVFRRPAYEPLARLSAVLAIALLAGGLTVLVLDLGRPDRLVVAMTHYNFSSIFAWNILLYTGFMAVVVVYLWIHMERRMQRHVRWAGVVAFAWRIVLTTGTGCIFGFLVARQAYDAAIMAPMFVAMSLSLGLAVFILVLLAAASMTARPLDEGLLRRLARLQALFVSVVLYFVVARHLANLYVAEHGAVERFLLLDGGQYPVVFWVGQILAGTLAPLAILWWWRPRSRGWTAAAAALVVVGGLSQLYGIIIGGQAAPLDIFPGKEVIEGALIAGEPASYAARLPELLLGLGGAAVSGLILVVAVRVLRILPERLDEAGADDTGNVYGR